MFRLDNLVTNTFSSICWSPHEVTTLAGARSSPRTSSPSSQVNAAQCRVSVARTWTFVDLLLGFKVRLFADLVHSMESIVLKQGQGGGQRSKRLSCFA